MKIGKYKITITIAVLVFFTLLNLVFVFTTPMPWGLINLIGFVICGWSLWQNLKYNRK